jgi:hypothetical protein
VRSVAGDVSKTVLAVVSIGDRPWFAFCLPWMNHFCRRFGYDLIVFRSPLIPSLSPENLGGMKLYGRCQKFGIGFLFNLYDRIIQLDDTCMVSPLAPDLTALVPENAVGCYVEGLDLHDRHRSYFELHKELYKRATPLSKERFFNGGVAVFSRSHAALYDIDSIPWLSILADKHFPHQGYLSHRADVLGLPLHDIGPAFNFVGSRIKKLRRPEDANAHIFHLTSALRPDKRLIVARLLDDYFRSLMSSSSSKDVSKSQMRQA